MGTREIAQRNGRLGGRPKGSKSKKTLERERVLRELQQRTMQAADLLFDKMLHVALGQAFLFKIEKYYIKEGTGKNTRKILKSKPPKMVTEPEEIREYLTEIAEGPIVNRNREDDYYFITTEKPDVRAIEAMMNRTFGRSVQPAAFTDEEGKSVIDPETKKKSDSTISALFKQNGDSKKTGKRKKA